MASGKLRVAVIGAGAAGLCAARHIVARPLTYEPPVVYEMTGRVGGTWVYVEESNQDGHIHSSMYRDLRTNLPKEIMEFPDFPFDASLPSFMHHTKVLQYLEDYTDTFGIRPHIRFHCPVVSVCPILEEGETGQVCWDVASHTVGESQPVTERFDAVMVCVGHYSHPFIPDIAGIDTFQGVILHSHEYRYPEPFSSRSVVLLGSGPSGVDIALEIARHAKHVTLSHRGPPLKWKLPGNVSLAPPVVSASPHSLICSDGTQLEADTLIFCTGYRYNYPFLIPRDSQVFNEQTQEDGGQLGCSEESQQANKELSRAKEGLNRSGELSMPDMGLLEVVEPDMGQGHLPPLYKHLIHARYPTMCFIGATKIVVPFPLFHNQVLFFLAVLEGRCPLRSPEQMLSESREELRDHQSAGLALKYLHRLERDQWEYNWWLAETAGFAPLPPVFEKIYEACRMFRYADPSLYRGLNFQKLSDDEFRLIESIQ
ncbi:uncharacterized protein WCC33_006651 [Rhinophrynus dorsalis]